MKTVRFLGGYERDRRLSCIFGVWITSGVSFFFTLKGLGHLRLERGFGRNPETTTRMTLWPDPERIPVLFFRSIVFLSLLCRGFWVPSCIALLPVSFPVCRGLIFVDIEASCPLFSPPFPLCHYSPPFSVAACGRQVSIRKGRRTGQWIWSPYVQSLQERLGASRTLSFLFDVRRRGFGSVAGQDAGVLKVLCFP